MELAGGEALRAALAEHGFTGTSPEAAVAAAVVAGRRGDKALDELARRLALGLSSACVVLDPALVVLAGEVGHAGGAELAGRVQRAVAAIAPVAPNVVASTVPADPVLHGALSTALEAARDEVFGSMLS